VPGGSSAGGIGGADCISKRVHRMMRCGDYGVKIGIIWVENIFVFEVLVGGESYTDGLTFGFE
jgi:hypothetical protein